MIISPLAAVEANNGSYT